MEASCAATTVLLLLDVADKPRSRSFVSYYRRKCMIYLKDIQKGQAGDQRNCYGFYDLHRGNDELEAMKESGAVLPDFDPLAYQQRISNLISFPSRHPVSFSTCVVRLVLCPTRFSEASIAKRSQPRADLPAHDINKSVIYQCLFHT